MKCNFAGYKMLYQISKKGTLELNLVTTFESVIKITYDTSS
jgi:hypothetical protein